MATQKLRLDATSANRALGALTVKVREYNEEVKKGSRLLATLNKRSAALTDSFKQQQSAMSGTARKTQFLGTQTHRATQRLASFRNELSDSKSSLVGLRSSANAASKELTSAGIRAEKFKRRLNEAAEATRRENVATNRAAASLAQFDRQIRSIVSVMRTKNGVIAQQTKVTKEDSLATKKLSGDMSTLANSARSLKRILISFAAFRAFSLLTEAIKNSVGAAKEFDQAISEVQTISRTNALATSEWRRELITLSSTFGVDKVESTEAAYQALSNQVVQAGGAVSFLREQVKLATITVSSLDDATQASSSIINAFGLEVGNASSVTADLFKTVELGRLRLSEIANTIGRVSILSNQLSISFIEQQAAIALLTRSGVKVDAAMTLLRALMLKLIKPTDRMKEVFAEWGVESGGAAIQTFGLVGTMEKFLQVANSGTDAATEFAAIFGRQRATVAAAALSQADLNAEIQKFSTSGVDAAAAFEERMNSISKRADIQTEKVKNFFDEAFGRPILNKLVTWSEAVGGADKALAGTLNTVLRATNVYIGYRVAVAAMATVQRLNIALTTQQAATHHVFTRASTATAAGLALQTSVTGRLTTAQHAQINATNAAALAQQRANLAMRNAAVARGVATLGITLIIARLIETASEAQNVGQKVQSMGRDMEQAFAEKGAKSLSKLQAQLKDTFFPFEQEVNRVFRAFNQVIADTRANSNRTSVQLTQDWERIGLSIQKSMLAPLDQVDDRIRFLRAAIRELARNAEARRDIAGDLVNQRDFDARRRAADPGRRINDDNNLNARLANLRKLKALQEEIQGEGLQNIAQGNLKQADVLFQQAKQVEQELKQRLEGLKRLAGEAKVPAPKQEKGFILQEAKAAGDLKVIQTELAQIEKDKLTFVNKRIEAEKAFAVEQEVKAIAAEIALQQQEKAFNRLKELLKELDQFEGNAAQFGPLAAGIRGAAGDAGLDKNVQLQLERELNQKRVILAKQAEAAINNDKLAQATKTLADVEQKVKKAIEAEKALRAGLNEAATQNVPVAVGNLLGQLRGFIAEAGQVRGRIAAPEARVRELEPLIGKVEERLDALRKAQGFEQQAIRAKRFREELDALLEKLAEIDFKGARQPVGLVGIGDRPRIDNSVVIDPKTKLTIEDQAEALKEQARALKEAEQAVRDNAGQQGNLQTILQNVKNSLLQLQPAWAANEQAGIKGTQEQIRLQEQLQQQLQRTIDLIRQAGGPVPGNNQGGAVRLAHGGPAQGIDHRRALLADGEFVMNRLASRQFSPMLHALNSAMPDFRGGQGNVSFGDINIHTPPGTSSDQVDAIMTQLQRQARLGNLNL